MHRAIYTVIRIISLFSTLVIFALGVAGCKLKSTDPMKTSSENVKGEQTMTLPDDWIRRSEMYTYYQTGAFFNSQTACQTDGVKVYINHHSSSLKALLDSYTSSVLPKPIMADFGAAQDLGSYFIDGKCDGVSHDDIVIRKKDGSVWQFGLLPGLPYILPTKEWNEYIASRYIDAIDTNEDVASVSLQELGVFGDTGYEQAFRDEWKAYYGTEWPEDLWDNPDHYYMGQDLRNFLSTSQVQQVFGAVKAHNGGIKTIFANHTSPAYYAFFNSVGNHDVMALPEVDGVEGQTWSNTMMIPFRYDGLTAERPFVTGLADYSFWSVLGQQFPEKSVAVITDPKGDGFDVTGVSLEKCKQLYRHQIVSQLAFSNIYRYNTVVWPDRAMSRGFSGQPVATNDFRTVICNIVSVQANMYKYQEEPITDSRPVKVGVILLDSACYQAGGPNNSITNDSFYGSFAPLIYNGIMVDAIPAGRGKSDTDVLKNYDIIIVSFDLMKPQNTLINEELAAYAQDGGIVLFLGGRTDYENIDSSWWKSAGYASPQDDLIARLGVKTGERITGIKSATLRPSKDDIAQHMGKIETVGANLIGYTSVEGGISLYTSENSETVAFVKPCGLGRFYYIGIDPEYFTGSGRDDIIFDLVKVIAQKHMSVSISPQNYISYQRGQIYGYSSMVGQSTTRKGIFIDLFDPELSIVTCLDVNEGESVLLYDVEDKMKGDVPAVLFAQGNNPAIYETKKRLRVVTAGPADTTGCVRVYLPDGYHPRASVAAVNGSGNNVLMDAVFDQSTGTILITYKNDLQKVIVDVTFTE